MRLGAYVLAADPTWISQSISAYYSEVEQLIISYDVDHRGWTGAPVDVASCIQKLRQLDYSQKMQFAPELFHGLPGSPADGETHQRSRALLLLDGRVDWALQLDTDELLPNMAALRAALSEAHAQGCAAVEWPMRVLYRRVSATTYLQVSNHDGTTHFEYPGPIAVRPGATLSEGRRTAGPTLRVVVRGDHRAAREATGPVWAIDEEDAIWHNSWARSPRSVWRKISSWGHNDGRAIYRYYATQWLPSPVIWRSMRDFHPFSWGRWDRLTPAPPLPFETR